MATDYILFIHGVNTRDKREKPEYADTLFALIQKNIAPSVKVEKISLYWGDVNKEKEEELEKNLKASKAWNSLWFQDFRQTQLLQFVGDAALYLSRHVGSQVAHRLKEQAEGTLGTFQSPKYQSGDRLHLVTHSWGTVILFDILFADRWENRKIPNYQDVLRIRKVLFGILPEAEKGIPLTSIHTMGSPIALFSLLHVNDSSHDFQPRLNQLLQYLYSLRNEKLPWFNYIHPGDPVAWPLEGVISKLVDEQVKLLDFEDVISHNADLSDFIVQPMSQSSLALLHGGDAHGSYLVSEQVAEKIANTINKSREISRN